MHGSDLVDRTPESFNRSQPTVHLVDCPMCRTAVPAEHLTRLIGRTMCRNCAAAWFEEDEAENDGKTE